MNFVYGIHRAQRFFRQLNVKGSCYMSEIERDWREWVRKAEQDLLNIKNNLAASEIPWSTIIFHAQQAAEKYLKAFLVSHAQEPKRTHDLRILCRTCSAIAPELAVLESVCADLDYLSEDIRYPGIPEESEDQM